MTLGITWFRSHKKALAVVILLVTFLEIDWGHGGCDNHPHVSSLTQVTHVRTS